MIKEIFIKNLRKIRKYRNISQMALAERCGTSTSYIGQIEIGNRFPSMELVEKIAVVLEIKPYMLFYDDNINNILPSSSKNNKITDLKKNEIIKNLKHAIYKLKHF